MRILFSKDKHLNQKTGKRMLFLKLLSQIGLSLKSVQIKATLLHFFRNWLVTKE